MEGRGVNKDKGIEQRKDRDIDQWKINQGKRWRNRDLKLRCSFTIYPLGVKTLGNIQSPQDFAGLFCDSCGLKFLILRELFQKVAMKVAVFFRCLLR